MNKKEIEILDNLETIPDTKYKKNVLFEKYKKYISMSNYDFDQQMISKNIGDEKRTFFIMNKSKPLLSPSRLLKPMTEHKYWMIPQLNLLKPRIMGQIVHHLLELSIQMKSIIKIDLEELQQRFPVDYENMTKNWNKETIDSMLQDVNNAVVEIVNFLSKNNIVVLRVEKHVCNSEFHGFIDLMCLKKYDGSNRKQPLILDLKISSMEEMQPSWITQLAIYWEILQRTCTCAILLFNRNTKKCELIKVKTTDLDKHANLFNQLVKIHRG